VTAIATVTLATVAILTMRDTRRAIKATEQQAELATRSFALQIEPHLIPYDGQPTIGDVEDIGGVVGQVWVVPFFVTIVNVGNGVARIDSVEVVRVPGGPPHRVIPSPVAQPGKLTSVRADFMVPPPPEISTRNYFAPGESVTFAVAYSGVADNARRELHFKWRLLSGRLWELEFAPPKP